MSHIAIPIPHFEGKQEIQIQVVVNNQIKSLRYKVELFYWDECQNPNAHRADCISEMLGNHDSNWLVYSIGTPTEKFVPITFVDRESKKWMQVR